MPLTTIDKHRQLVMNHLCQDIHMKCNNKHRLCAIITKGKNKVLFIGNNDNNRTKCGNNISFSTHAEMSVIHQFMNQVRKNEHKFINKSKSKNKLNRRDHRKYNFNKYTLWVYRIRHIQSSLHTPHPQEFVFDMCKPCTNCCKSLKELGFRNVIYTNEDGIETKMDMRYETNDFITSGNRRFIQV
jgi:tRNA(Arg) A34 adenosine deaminase TadA